MKKTIFISFIVLILALTACGGDTKPNKPAISNSTSQTKSQITQKEENTEPDYVPEKAVPKDLPVYPGAFVFYDSEIWADEGTGWMWFYSTTASANEIVAFFKTELLKSGLEIDTGFTYALGEEFSVSDTTGTLTVGWLDDGLENVNPDTPGRGYLLMVKLEAWAGR